MAEAQVKLDAARKELYAAQARAKDINEAKANTAVLRMKADEAKQNADRARAQTLANGKNPDNPDEAPITYITIQTWRKADAEAKAAMRNVEKLEDDVALAERKVAAAEQAFREAQQNDRPVSSPSSQPNPGRPEPVGAAVSEGRSLLPYLFASFVLVVVLAVGAGYVELRRVRLAQEKGEEDLLIRMKSHEREIADISHQVRSAREEARAFGAKLEMRLADLAYSVKEQELALMMPAGRGAGEPVAEGRQAVTAVAGSTIHQREVVTKELQLAFPMTVAECLATLRESGAKTVGLKAAGLRGGLLVKGEGGGFVLVEEDRPEHPLLVVPTLERFVTKQDYYTNYDDFYHCAKVTSGEVRVVRPAVVEKVADGWRLTLKGELKV